jgi:4-alpha-glucanotransferase
VYSGTHDNNTTIGWWEEEVNKRTSDFIAEYLGQDVEEINWAMIRLGMMSAGHTFVAPMQDVLGLDETARMNTPGTESGNWTWRFSENAFDDPAQGRLSDLTWLYQRKPEQQKKTYGDAAVSS